MKVGDLVRYNYPGDSTKLSRPDEVLMVMYVNTHGGTLKCLTTGGKVVWGVKSYCEVISESR
ncbi:hypothetical protein OAA64_01760 [bacterium]|jgi:hypothetical protein|nr:hypothetical protein [bacterium]